MTTCPFCTPASEAVFYADDPQFLCLWDRHPVSRGHALVIARRHVPTWFDASIDERAALTRGIDVARATILRLHDPAGFNIGVNVGAVAGQTVPHLHVHVIPRYTGDVPNPRGGVRCVIPHLADPGQSVRSAAPLAVNEGAAVLEATSSAPSRSIRPLTARLSGPDAPPIPAPRPPILVGSDTDPFLPHLLADLQGCRALDLAVAFVTPQGLARIRPYLEDILSRGGGIRFVTGDYLGFTDPEALLNLLDLEGRDGNPGSLRCRVFETNAAAGFHPKVYVIHERSAWVGSSNLTHSALELGLESNFRVDSERDPEGFAAALREFALIFEHPNTKPLTEEWVRAYAARRATITRPVFTGVAEEPAAPPPTPNSIQVEALKQLRKTRTAGNKAGLVVLATGLGKTWLSAFDCEHYAHVLFVAHREEILTQARDTYRRIRPKAHLGFFTGQEKDRHADVLFASIQTLARKTHLESFPKDHFDYIVVDEFHHAVAKTYRRLLAHFEPKFLLGLTATPERSDGQDLLALCLENHVYRCDVLEGVRRGELCPFHYFGVPDEVDYAQIPWRNGRFDPTALELAVATQARAQNALEQWRRYAGPGSRTLAFCVSTRHADFMRAYFRERGIKAAAVHSKDSSDSRAASLEALETSRLEVVFCVDMFNEGVDLPSVDSILMLRPTESRVLWLQQVGRGLRKQAGKTLRIVDYVGNHRTFLGGILTLLPLDNETPTAVAAALRRIERHELELPPGCQVTYDLKALNILRALVPTPPPVHEAVRKWYLDFRDRNGVRPTASEAWHAGYDPKVVRRHDGSWLGFVRGMGDMDSEADATLASSRMFFEALETTPMTRSYKMLLLTAWLEEGGFPAPISINALTAGVERVVRRSRALQRDVGEAHESTLMLRSLLEANPIPAWIDAKGTGGTSYFAYDDSTLSFTLQSAGAHASALRELTQELVDWRLAQYLARGSEDSPATQFSCNVSYAGAGRPILFLPDRGHNPGLPLGEIRVRADGRDLVARVVKLAINVVRQEGSEENLLPGMLREWFGPDAGRPGRGPDRVQFEWTGGGYRMSPVRGSSSYQAQPPPGPVLWQEYERTQTTSPWGLPFPGQMRQQGYGKVGNMLLLLVTLEKDKLPAGHKYADRFLSPVLFQWQSQNRTSQASKPGQDIRNHQDRGLDVQLFVRRMPKTQTGKATPFTYCGQVDFVSWEGNKPITVEWRLRNPVPDNLRRALGVPGV